MHHYTAVTAYGCAITLIMLFRWHFRRRTVVANFLVSSDLLAS